MLAQWETRLPHNKLVPSLIPGWLEWPFIFVNTVQSDPRINFMVYVKFRLISGVRFFFISVIRLLLPSDFMDELGLRDKVRTIF